MKYLSSYMNDRQTEAFTKYGAFFAFSGKQLEEQRVEGVNYCNMGAGMIAPIENRDKLLMTLDTIYKESIEQDLEENGKVGVIHRELGNYECQITNDISEVVGVLDPYGITESDIRAEWSSFYTKCVQNDWF